MKDLPTGFHAGDVVLREFNRGRRRLNQREYGYYSAEAASSKVADDIVKELGLRAPLSSEHDEGLALRRAIFKDPSLLIDSAKRVEVMRRYRRFSWDVSRLSGELVDGGKKASLHNSLSDRISKDGAQDDTDPKIWQLASDLENCVNFHGVSMCSLKRDIPSSLHSEAERWIEDSGNKLKYQFGDWKRATSDVSRLMESRDIVRSDLVDLALRAYGMADTDINSAVFALRVESTTI